MTRRIAGAMGPRIRQTSPADQSVDRTQKAVQALHAVREMDWKGFFEQNNVAERVLRQDPSGDYPHMDDESREMYRKVVQDLARQSLFSEEEVARQAVFLAMRAKSRTRNPDSRAAGPENPHRLLLDGRRHSHC